jgi:hypothetical protein
MAPTPRRGRPASREIVPIFLCREMPDGERPEIIAYSGTGFRLTDDLLIICWHCVEERPGFVYAVVIPPDVNLIEHVRTELRVVLRGRQSSGTGWKLIGTSCVLRPSSTGRDAPTPMKAETTSSLPLISSRRLSNSTRSPQLSSTTPSGLATLTMSSLPGTLPEPTGRLHHERRSNPPRPRPPMGRTVRARAAAASRQATRSRRRTAHMRPCVSARA